MLQWSEAGELGECARASAALLVWVYAVLFAQSYVKVALVQRKRQQGFGLMSYRGMSYSDPRVARIKYNTDYDSPLAVVADRTAGNLLEQLTPFLAATWLRAMLVPGAADSAGRLTYVYLVSRMAYPAAFYAGHPILQLSTQPGYVIVWGQLADVVMCAGNAPAWWSAAGSEVAIYGVIAVCQVLILIMWAAPLLGQRVPDAQAEVAGSRATTPRRGVISSLEEHSISRRSQGAQTEGGWGIGDGFGGSGFVGRGVGGGEVGTAAGGGGGGEPARKMVKARRSLSQKKK
jgi:uncharacterized MAPEG superfamily protein